MTDASTKLLLSVLVGVVALGGGVGLAVTDSAGNSNSRATVSLAPVPPVPVPPIPVPPVPVPVVNAVGQVGGTVPWDHPLTLTVTNGTLTSVAVLDPDGQPLAGELTDVGWSSRHSLLPSSTYRSTATVLDTAGKTSQVAVSTVTSLATKTLHAVMSPGDDDVVGVGMTVIATLNRSVTGAADRALVEARFTVATTPKVAGAWRWMSPTELHYRGATFWAAGTTIKAHVNFTRLHLSDGTWGKGIINTSYRIGSAVISTVDVTKHLMTVVVDGKLVRTVKVSTGRDKYPTKGGVHLVLEKTKLKTMDSTTVGIPRNSADGYYEKVPNSVRISYSGEFVHSADWSVRDQGVRNVSHGCVNVSPTDAAWFFDHVRRGDVVKVIHAAIGPKLSDPGMSDWNIAFANWAN